MSDDHNNADGHNNEYGRLNTNMTDKEIDENPGGAAGAVLNPHNDEHVSDDDQSAAGRVLGGTGSKEDEDRVKDAAKGIPKNPTADRRDKEQKGE